MGSKKSKTEDKFWTAWTHLYHMEGHVKWAWSGLSMRNVWRWSWMAPEIFQLTQPSLFLLGHHRNINHQEDYFLLALTRSQTATGCERANLQQWTCTVTPDLCAKTSWCQTAFPLARGMKMEEQVNIRTGLPKQKQSMAQCLNDSRATAALCQGKRSHQHTVLVLQEEQKAQCSGISLVRWNGAGTDYFGTAEAATTDGQGSRATTWAWSHLGSASTVWKMANNNKKIPCQWHPKPTVLGLEQHKSLSKNGGQRKLWITSLCKKALELCQVLHKAWRRSSRGTSGTRTPLK